MLTKVAIGAPAAKAPFVLPSGPRCELQQRSAKEPNVIDPALCSKVCFGFPTVSHRHFPPGKISRRPSRQTRRVAPFSMKCLENREQLKDPAGD